MLQRSAGIHALTTNDSTLGVESVAYRYTATGPRLGPFTFSAHPGQIWAVLGSNGAGKSTLFRLIAGELRPTEGSVRLGGTTELIPQGAAIPGRLTVTQTLDYLALLRHVPRDQRASNVAEALRLVDLVDLADTRVRKLSGGQHRRLVIGQALVARPMTLLMDEPSAGLDLDQRATLRSTVAAIGQERLVLISSHIVEDLAGVADHVLHLAEGRLVFAGTSQEYVEATGTSGHVDSVERWTEAYRTWNAKDRKGVSA